MLSRHGRDFSLFFLTKFLDPCTFSYYYGWQKSWNRMVDEAQLKAIFPENLLILSLRFFPYSYTQIICLIAFI